MRKGMPRASTAVERLVPLAIVLVAQIVSEPKLERATVVRDLGDAPQASQHLRLRGLVEAFDLAVAFGIAAGAEHEMDAELGARRRRVIGDEARSVIEVEDIEQA